MWNQNSMVCGATWNQAIWLQDPRSAPLGPILRGLTFGNYGSQNTEQQQRSREESNVESRTGAHPWVFPHIHVLRKDRQIEQASC